MSKIIIAIETSCDETSIAAITLDRQIIYEKTYSQIPIHKQYGGVVPEIASRNHNNQIQTLFLDFKKYIIENNLKIENICTIAATAGPGLIGSLIVGTSFAKGLALFLNKPFIAVNHLEGHIMSAMIEKEIEFPFIVLLASGGHSQIIFAEKFGNYKLLGSTLDDAAGECFDKIAKMLGLEYPGGPNLEKMAKHFIGKKTIKFKTGIINNKNLNFSFSGLKTQVLYKIKSFEKLEEKDKIEIAFASQEAIVKTLLYKSQMAIDLIKSPVKNFVICGGVSANQFLRQEFEFLCKKNAINLVTPALKYSTDNATMIAFAALEKFKQKQFNKIDFTPKSHWPL
jgi:N6-L-threonylcarbamoyladenine synthase